MSLRSRAHRPAPDRSTSVTARSPTANWWRSPPTGKPRSRASSRHGRSFDIDTVTMLLRWHSPGARVVARADLAPIPRRAESIQELLLIAHLDTAPVPARVRLALFHAAAALPGATITAGKTHVTVSASSPHWQPVSFAFDAHTGELLTGLPVDGGYPDVPGPASTVVAQGPVDSITALPKGVRPIPRCRGLPLWPSPSAPPFESVSPAVGGPAQSVHRAAFRLCWRTRPSRPKGLARHHRLGRSGDLPRREAGVRPKRRFLPGSQGVDPCLPPASVRVWPARTIRRAGRLVFVYRVTPLLFHLRAWCAGRYQLGIQTFPNPLPPHYTTPPYTGPSGTSVYFEVRLPPRS